MGDFHLVSFYGTCYQQHHLQRGEERRTRPFQIDLGELIQSRSEPTWHNANNDSMSRRKESLFHDAISSQGRGCVNGLQPALDLLSAELALRISATCAPGILLLLTLLTLFYIILLPLLDATFE